MDGLYGGVFTTLRQEGALVQLVLAYPHFFPLFPPQFFSLFQSPQS
jgi:hypothetical protein